RTERGGHVRREIARGRGGGLAAGSGAGMTAVDPAQAASAPAEAAARTEAGAAPAPARTPGPPAHAPGLPPEARTAGRRRRPSGEGPALPRELRRSGRFWIIGLSLCAAFLIYVAIRGDHAIGISSLDAAVSRAFASIRVAWLTAIANALNWLSSDWVNLA